jgi:AbrB family looped-hinge helix DNA binding protein
MMRSKIAKNGTINFPVSIRKKLGVDIGDSVSFVVTDDEVIVVPVRKLEDLTSPDNYEKAVEIIEEITEEHRREREA